MADLQKLADGTVADAEKALPKLKAFELAELRDMEKAGKNRSTLLDAIDAAEAKALEAAPGPEADKRDAAEQAAYNQGRHARKNGIGEAQSPHSKGVMRDAWVEGWQYQDSL